MTHRVNPVSDAVAELHRRGGYLVLIKPGTKIPASPWRDGGANLDVALSHVDKGGRIGVVPASLGCIVVDSDPKLPGASTGGRPPVWRCPGIRYAAERIIGSIPGVKAASFVTATPSGGSHTYILSRRCDVGNGKWKYGDIRGSHGYVVMWDPVAVANGLDSLADARPAQDPAKFLPRSWKPGCGPGVVALTAEGARNDTLVKQVYQDARNGCWRNVDREVYMQAALHAGLDESEIDKTIDSGVRGGEEARAKAEVDAAGKSGPVVQVSDPEDGAPPDAYERTPEDLSKMLCVLGAQVRMNLRTGEPEYCGHEDSPWEPVTPTWRAWIHEAVTRRFDTGEGAWRKVAFGDCMDALFHLSRTDPVADMLNGLPEWDGVKRLHTWIEAHGGTGRGCGKAAADLLKDVVRLSTRTSALQSCLWQATGDGLVELFHETVPNDWNSPVRVLTIPQRGRPPAGGRLGVWALADGEAKAVRRYAADNGESVRGVWHRYTGIVIHAVEADLEGLGAKSFSVPEFRECPDFNWDQVWAEAKKEVA